MSCTVPGTWLVLRRQSMMGDALSHTALPGIVVAFLAAAWLTSSGIVSRNQIEPLEHWFLFTGAAFAGVATAWLTETIQRIGRVEANTALGVVFTSLFALGLFLVRFVVDDVHLDADCVLFGNLTEVALDTRLVFGVELSRGAIVNGALLLLNLLLTLLFFKELRISAFDPELATVQGINARVMHYAHMAITAITVVAAFETVGSILVVSLLVVPAATALLLCQRLVTLIIVALSIAAASGLLGFWFALDLAGPIFESLGFPGVPDVSPTGMIAVTAGLLFFACWIISPHSGLLMRLLNRLRLSSRIIAEDVLSALYRQSEQQHDKALNLDELETHLHRMWLRRWLSRWALCRYRAQGLVEATGEGFLLTEAGRSTARDLVRAHRLWESYLDRHFQIPSDHLHAATHRAEHFLDPTLSGQLMRELDKPASDPHGREIPHQHGDAE